MTTCFCPKSPPARRGAGTLAGLVGTRVDASLPPFSSSVGRRPDTWPLVSTLPPLRTLSFETEIELSVNAPAASKVLQLAIEQLPRIGPGHGGLLIGSDSVIDGGWLAT
jgi:hypothetical protein